MANNYLQFSFAIPDLTEPEIEWLRALLAVEPEDDDPDNPVGIGKYGEDPEYFGGTVEIDDDGLWIYAEESGTPEDAACFVQAFLAAHRPGDAIGFEWAATCSKMRLDEFGGGAVLITATDQTWMSSSQWLAGQLNARKAST